MCDSKRQKIFENWMKINSNSICLIGLQLEVGVKLFKIGFIQNSFDLKICNSFD